MPKLEELPSPWPAFLRELDQALSCPVELHCLGGFVLAVLYGLPRPTDDLDYVSIIPRDSFAEIDRLAGRGSPLSKKYKVFLQNVGSIPDLPENYDERLTALVGLDLPQFSLNVLAPHDLILSKLTRNSPKDREDVKFLADKLKLNFKNLMDIFDAEMKPWLPNLNRHLLTLKLWREYFPH
jgi:hypothetical protein